MLSKPEIVDVQIFEDRIEITKRERSNRQYLCAPPRPVPDTVWKEIYRPIDGKIVLSESIKGTHYPAYQVKERFDFTPRDPNKCPDCESTEFEMDELRHEKVCKQCGLVIEVK